MKTVVERFLKYVSFDTASMHDQDAIPSTDKQKLLAEALVGELKAMGIKNARMDEHGYVYARIEANADGIPVLGFIAHHGYLSGRAGGERSPPYCKALRRN